MNPPHPAVVVPEDDAAVMGRSRDEPEAFAELFERHAAEIKRYVIRRLGADHAEDVVAETFLVAFRRRGSYDPARSDARPWLYGIATNLIGRHRRTEIRLLRVVERTGADPVVESFTERSDTRVSATAARRSLAAALARLPAAHRNALLLLAWGGLTYEETAAALGVPIGTVRSRISRARTKMRAALGGADPTALREETTHG
ncbi:RNA polymerase sigma factor [Rhizohabitans arisaemae]|uniref:RNA polymerase sigma factor n=1 Tax=Rhizohabitans arisaemae TaxID=2720610 RepID=UPI0024B1D682|nr:RNA polymerase sigma factor [Rhizohabitans arisaemae]